MLLEAEENKMEMYEKEYEQVIADWKAGLPIRKQVSYFFFIFFFFFCVEYYYKYARIF